MAKKKKGDPVSPPTGPKPKVTTEATGDPVSPPTGPKP